jgi:GNAT superfamily N-acetyltransferase
VADQDFPQRPEDLILDGAAQAAAARRGCFAHEIKPVSQMTDAAALEIRPIVPEDKAGMLEAFNRLSPESRYRRFLAPHGRLSNAELRYFTEVDHHDHEALVAVEPATQQGVGVARYVRSAEDPSRAEMAVAVTDDWHGRGVGSQLLAALVDRARREGIHSFSALVLAENDQMLALLAELGAVRVLRRDQGSVELIVELPPTGIGRVKRLLAAAASGEIVASPMRALRQLR